MTPLAPTSWMPLFELSDLAPEKHPGVCAEPSRRNPGITRTGTNAGYQAHLTAGEKACDACVIAKSARSAARRGPGSLTPDEYRRYRLLLDRYKERIARGERVPACAKPTFKHPDGRTGITHVGWMAHYSAKEPPCEACVKGNAVHGRTFRAANPEGILQKNLRYKFNLPLEEYRAKLQAQDGKCAICGVVSPADRRFPVDHDHRCCPGKRTCGNCTRGLLCDACNKALGGFKDDPDILMSAVAYLLSHTNVLEAIHDAR